MINLSQHIEVLLLDHDCVIIPELGGFVVRRESAYLDEESKLFYPPHLSVGFNSKLVINDGIIVQSVMEAIDTDYPNASRMVEKEVNSIKNKLQDGWTWEIGRIGSMKQTADGSLIFSPMSEGGIPAPHLFGLDAVDTTIVVKENSKDIVQTTSSVADSDIDYYDEEEEEETPKFRIVRRALKYAAVFVGIVALLFVSSVSVSDMQLGKRWNSLAVVDCYMQPLKPIFKQAHQSIENKVEEITTLKENLSEQTTEATSKSSATSIDASSSSAEEKVSTKEADSYTIVLACQVKLVNAENLIQSLSKKGFGAGRVMEKNNMRRVVYGSFEDENGAYNELRKLRKASSQFDEAWVMHVTND